MQFRVDRSWRRHGSVVIAGSPLRIFRLTARGTELVEHLASGDDIEGSPLTDRLLDAGAVHPLPPSHLSHTIDDVTVVTPVFGGSARAGRITVDDGSQPPVGGADIRLPTNRGPAAARNAARPLVRTGLIAFVDDDVDLLDDVAGSWLIPLLGHFDDPRVGLVAPRVTGEPDCPLDLGGDSARIRAQSRVSYVPAAAIVVRTQAFDSVGGFDEVLRVGEDVDFVWRLGQAGWICRYEPASVVWHEPRSSLRERIEQHRRYGSSAAPLALRHPEALAPWQADTPTALAWTALLIGAPITALGLGLTNVLTLWRRVPGLTLATIIGLAIHGHTRIALQLAAAIRREWLPIALALGITSRRARWALLAALALAPGRIVTDAAYGCGVWQGMRRHRTLLPIIPRIRSWPPGRQHPAPR